MGLLVAEALLRLPRRLTLQDARFLFFMAALIIYAFWGTPTPDFFALPELFIALFLVAAVGPAGIGASLRPVLPRGREEGWLRAGQVLMLYGVSIPVLVALWRGNEPGLLLRDGVAFLFFLLPLFLYPLIGRNPVRIIIITIATVMVGVIFSARVFVPAFFRYQGWGDILGSGQPVDPAYLANAPTVLFAGLLLVGLAGLRLYTNSKPQIWGQAVVLFLLGSLPLMTMALILQRANLGLGLAGLSFLLVLTFVRHPYRALPIFLAAGLVLLAAWPMVLAVGGELAAKNAAVGLNQRWQEAAAVMAVLEENSAAILWGQGWGATLISPAVGEYPVNFTHNLLTSYWLKTGIIGVGLVVFYLGALARLLWPLLWRYPVLAVALAAPLAIDMMLYASFKSLDFGLILLLLAVWGGRGVSLHPGGIYSMSERPQK